ncbi:hypothetical protein SAMN06295967_10633 [Belliella buryatensis]|uniref:DUF7793 domain-containing protein n=1 Tax=Belliella buryatensis TaxID=1500549 RepID=A0A239CZP5_9BACT|nr:hypothetical protein [Belliella buryatensis]SNS25419.1 hypothetical protein SAMN06295967_10633 [Belliella buryatensis]
MEAYALVDNSEFPLVMISFTGNKSTDENFQAYLASTKAVYRHERKLAIIFDATFAGVPSIKHQKMQANWLKENEPLMQQYCIATAYVIPNMAVRTVLKFIFALQKQPVPYQIFEKQQDARHWIDGLLSKSH